MADWLSVGAGASAGLEKVLARRLLEQQIAQRQQEAQQEFALRQQQLQQQAADRQAQMEASQQQQAFLNSLKMADYQQGVGDTTAEQLQIGDQVAPQTEKALGPTYASRINTIPLMGETIPQTAAEPVKQAPPLKLWKGTDKQVAREDAASERVAAREDTQANQRFMQTQAAKDRAALAMALKSATGSGGPDLGVGGMSALPTAEQATARSIMNYKYPVPTGGFAMNNPKWQRIIGAVMQEDPSFDASQYAARVKLRQDMTAGKSSQNIRSFNTAIAHLETLRKAAKDLENTSIPAWNYVKNAAGQATGDPRIIRFINAANAVAAEAATAFKGTAGTDQEIKQWHSGIGPNMSPDQINGALDTITELLAGRIAETSQQFERGMGKPKDFHFLSDKSRRILTGQGVDPDVIDPAGAGTEPSAPAPQTPKILSIERVK